MSDSEDKPAASEQDFQKQEDSNQDVSELTVKVDNVQLEENKEENKQPSPKDSKPDDSKKSPTKESTEKQVEVPETPAVPSKIEILLKAVGNAPILKKKKFLLERTKNVHYIVEWLRKYMKLDSKEQLFVYVNQEFAPSPDAEIGTIFDCFKTGNNVILHYCTTPAWG